MALWPYSIPSGVGRGFGRLWMDPNPNLWHWPKLPLPDMVKLFCVGWTLLLLYLLMPVSLFQFDICWRTLPYLIQFPDTLTSPRTELMTWTFPQYYPTLPIWLMIGRTITTVTLFARRDQYCATGPCRRPAQTQTLLTNPIIWLLIPTHTLVLWCVLLTTCPVVPVIGGPLTPLFSPLVLQTWTLITGSPNGGYLLQLVCLIDLRDLTGLVLVDWLIIIPNIWLLLILIPILLG